MQFYPNKQIRAFLIIILSSFFYLQTIPIKWITTPKKYQRTVLYEGSFTMLFGVGLEYNSIIILIDIGSKNLGVSFIIITYTRTSYIIQRQTCRHIYTQTKMTSSWRKLLKVTTMVIFNNDTFKKKMVLNSTNKIIRLLILS